MGEYDKGGAARIVGPQMVENLYFYYILPSGAVSKLSAMIRSKYYLLVNNFILKIFTSLLTFLKVEFEYLEVCIAV